jgi:hypothetical protein
MELNVKVDEYELRVIRKLLAQRQAEYRDKGIANEEWFEDLISRINPYNEKVTA